LIRRRIEEGFGQIKTVAILRKTKHDGTARVGFMFTLAAAAYNLVRIPKLVADAVPRSGRKNCPHQGWPRVILIRRTGNPWLFRSLPGPFVLSRPDQCSDHIALKSGTHKLDRSAVDRNVFIYRGRALW
jgi:hypothetical protein